MEIEHEFRVVFFAGGETRNNKFNVFTGSFIGFLTDIMGTRFKLIKDIYFRYPMFNIIWGLNNAQKPVKDPSINRITSSSLNQLLPENKKCPDTLIILSSSSGSIVAAQTACCLAYENLKYQYYINPFHIVLGTTFISKESELFKKLKYFQQTGQIGKIIFDELQDEEDSIYGAGGKTRREAWSNALGLILPLFSKKFKSPSFLNTDPVRGHIHRRRSQSVKKAIDFIEVIFLEYNLAGDYYRGKAADLVANQNKRA